MPATRAKNPALAATAATVDSTQDAAAMDRKASACLDVSAHLPSLPLQLALVAVLCGSNYANCLTGTWAIDDTVAFLRNPDVTGHGVNGTLGPLVNAVPHSLLCVRHS
eukprot:SAG11_NODE_3479_length_2423_cov_2.950516_2_plen_108_part_00